MQFAKHRFNMAVIGRIFSNRWLENLIITRNLLIKSRCRPRHLTTEKECKTSTDEITKDTINVSENCVKRLKEIIEDDSFLRISVEGGGCSGFQYKFELDTKVEDDDVVFEKNGVKVVTDVTSLQYLKGSTIDYHSELIKSAFRIINNPQAAQACSCGTSFNIKL